MTKIPVGRTIAHAWRFVISQCMPLLTLAWLPLLLMLLANTLVSPQIMALSQGLRTHDYSGMTMAWPLILLLYAAVLVATAMVVTAIYQYALGKVETRDRWFYFSLAMPLWRLIGAVLLMLLVLLALLVVYILAILVLVFLFRLGLGAAQISDSAIQGIMEFDTLLAFVIGYCGFIFCGMRFGFLLAAATIAEDRIALTRSWTLSHGNFWRMFAIILALCLPLLFVELCAFYALGVFPHVPAGASLAEIRALQNAASAAAFAKMGHYWYLFYPGGGILAFLTYGLLAGAQSFAWRVLTGDEPITNRP